MMMAWELRIDGRNWSRDDKCNSCMADVVDFVMVCQCGMT